MVVINVLLIIVTAFFVTFCINWVINPFISFSDKIHFRDWWRNRPTWDDPERWKRFEKSIGENHGR